jgi:hypothetical protein
MGTWETFIFEVFYMRGKLMANSHSHYLPAQNTFKDNKNPNFKYTKALLSFVHYENT